MAATKSKKTRPSRRSKRVVIEGPEPRKRPVRKTIHLTEDHAYRLSVLAAMSSLNGREVNQSSIVEQALDAWFKENEHPREFEVKLTRNG